MEVLGGGWGDAQPRQALTNNVYTCGDGLPPSFDAVKSVVAQYQCVWQPTLS